MRQSQGAIHVEGAGGVNAHQFTGDAADDDHHHDIVGAEDNKKKKQKSKNPISRLSVQPLEGCPLGPKAKTGEQI